MATANKDFKVKNGVNVTTDVVVAGTLTAADPVNPGDLATKGYIDGLVFADVSDTAPSSPHLSKLWLDTVVNRLKVYTASGWVTIASKADTDHLQDHIHDDAIEGTGRISSVI
tara:strand:- start:1665 stop:2003 length:339 start_codon:yes stop_codon:yes gene_type:complete